MSARQRPTNVAASVRARLEALARERRVELQLVLSQFAIERLLYRLGVSPHADRFVLKGATLFRLWSDDRSRATWDLDLLGRGASGVDEVVAAVRDLCRIRVDDAIEFLEATIAGEEIRVPDEYAGVRVRLEGRLGSARIPVQVDVGFGDAVIPAPTCEVYPVLLNDEPPHILVYPREVVVAEKVEAISLGVTNSRMKDFYDVHRLAGSSTFDGDTLVRSIRATFERRRTHMPGGEPLVLQHGFLAAPERQTQWRAFLRRGRLDGPQHVEQLTEDLRRFLLPVLTAASESSPLAARWEPGGPWRPKPEGRTE